MSKEYDNIEALYSDLLNDIKNVVADELLFTATNTFFKL